jgi:hypothetical protein
MDESRQLVGVTAIANNGEPDGFASTAWSLVLAAADGPDGCSALDRLAAEKRKDGNATQFDQLRPFLTQPPGPGRYERLSESLGLPRARVAVIIHRYSRRFAELIRGEVAETLVDRTGHEIELRGLLEARAR